tara:strand:- start:635 stop:1216 length:582 start_codon:yes stop_codon:yes gene_type:complete
MIISGSKIEKLRRLQKESQKKTNKKGEILGIYNFAEAVVELDAIMGKITKDERKRVTEAARPLVLASYRNFVPTSNKSHNFYSRGMDRFSGPKYYIKPGNLKRSIQDISTFKRWRTLFTSIGPLYGDAGVGVTLNNESKTDGFYAHMIYGSTKAWISNVRNKAERATKITAINKMSEEALKVAKEYPRKFWEL